MRFFKEKHIENKLGIYLEHEWFWVRIGIWSFQVNFGKTENNDN